MINGWDTGLEHDRKRFAKNETDCLMRNEICKEQLVPEKGR